MKWTEVHPLPLPSPQSFDSGGWNTALKKMVEIKPADREDTNVSAQRFYLEIIN